MTMQSTKIKEASSSLFIIACSIGIISTIPHLKSAIESQHAMIEGARGRQSHLMSEARDSGKIVTELGYAAAILGMTRADMISGTDADRHIKDSIGAISVHSERLGKLVGLLNLYRKEENEKILQSNRHEAEIDRDIVGLRGRVETLNREIKDAEKTTIHGSPPPNDLSDSPDTKLSDQALRPFVKVGDTYLYETRAVDNPESAVTTRRTVTSVNGVIVLTAINTNNTNSKTRRLFFDGDWNLLRTRNADDSGLDYSPPLKYYDFPLFPGKTWHQVTSEKNIKNGAIRNHDITGTVGSWEAITVPAGTFRAIKVSLATVLVENDSGETIIGSDTSWYAPEVRRSVKSITTGKGGKQQLIQLISYDLK